MIGGGNSALQEALLLSEVCTKVTVVQNLSGFTGEKKLADALLEPVFSLSGALWYRWGIFLAGLLLLTGACALMIRLCPGMSVMDAIVTRLSEKLRVSFRAVRMTIDAALMVTGFLMGGVVGIGSVVAVLGTGPLIQFFVRFGKKG